MPPKARPHLVLTTPEPHVAAYWEKPLPVKPVGAVRVVLAERCLALDADVVALQEVTMEALPFIEKELSAVYAHSTAKQFIAKCRSGGYGEVVFSKHPIARTHVLPFPGSRMRRQLTICDIPAVGLRLGNTHLESMAMAKRSSGVSSGFSRSTRWRAMRRLVRRCA